jgi:hypothetical protein
MKKIANKEAIYTTLRSTGLMLKYVRISPASITKAARAQQYAYLIVPISNNKKAFVNHHYLPICESHNYSKITIDKISNKFNHSIGDRPQIDHFTNSLHHANGDNPNENEGEKCTTRSGNCDDLGT